MATAKGSNKIEGVDRIIAVSSGKGGVGKSTVAVNLAFSLAKMGHQVGLLDSDIYGPNVPTMAGVNDAPKIVNQGGSEVFLPPVGAERVKVMSMGFLVDPDQPMIWRGPMLHNVLRQFCHQVHWGTLDYLVIDMPPGTGDVQLSLAQLIPITGAVMVTTPQEVAMQDVRKAFQMWEKVKVPSLGIVENMSYYQDSPGAEKKYIFGKNGGQILADKYHTRLLGQIPVNPSICEAGDRGRPISLEQNETANTFASIAKATKEQVEALKRQGIDPSELVQVGKFE